VVANVTVLLLAAAITLFRLLDMHVQLLHMHHLCAVKWLWNAKRQLQCVALDSHGATKRVEEGIYMWRFDILATVVASEFLAPKLLRRCNGTQ